MLVVQDRGILRILMHSELLHNLNLFIRFYPFE